MSTRFPEAAAESLPRRVTSEPLFGSIPDREGYAMGEGLGQRPVADEASRLAALTLYKVLDTPPEFGHDALTELAAQICGCPAALISLVDDRRQWIKSNYGLPADLVECPREMSVCSTTICSNDLLYVPDLEADDRFRALPIVTGDPLLKFYCGMPLINRDGHALGTLCVLDFQPRELTPGQREAIRRLAQQAMAQLELRRQLLNTEELLREVSEARGVAEAAHARSDSLLRTLLPAAVAEELKAHGRVQPRYHESATILFADFKGFTRLTETLDPARLVAELDQNFARFDAIAESNRLETLKTMGDAYICAGGLPEPNRTHAVDACLAALQIQSFVAKTNAQRAKLRLAPWELRIGINTGPVVAGVVGARRLTYDVWGNAVNVAQRLEAASEPGRVNISASTLHHVARLFDAEHRGNVQVKHLGSMDMYFLVGIKPHLADENDGVSPNSEFWNLARA